MPRCVAYACAYSAISLNGYKFAVFERVPCVRLEIYAIDLCGLETADIAVVVVPIMDNYAVQSCLKTAVFTGNHDTVFTANLLRAVTANLLRAVTANLIRVVTANLIRAVTANLLRVVTANLLRAVTANLLRAVTANLIRGVTANLIRGVTANLIRVVTANLLRVVTANLIRVVTANLATFSLYNLTNVLGMQLADAHDADFAADFELLRDVFPVIVSLCIVQGFHLSKFAQFAVIVD